MKKNISEKKIIWGLLAAVLTVGIFVRTYKFHDWLRFNADQARDASVVYDAAKGETSLPLLGPRAGGTAFKLGPAFYYFQYASVKIFGPAPEKYAYPDLIFSILTILLFYFLFARLFDTRVGLFVAALCSVSLFMVKYGRFAWNPNSMPFFTTLFLLAAHKILAEHKRMWMWLGVLGVALGIGMQLHTFLLLVLPLLTLTFFAYLFFQKKFTWQKFVFVLAVAFVLNMPQLVSEMQNGFVNSKAFWGGTQVKTASSYSLWQRAGMDAQCHIRANAYILTSRGDSEECGDFSWQNSLKKNRKSSDALNLNISMFGAVAFVIIFSLGGYLLLVFYAYREKDVAKQGILFLVLAYTLLTFLVLIPVGNDLSIRYFLASAFVPFFLLAVWIKFLTARWRWLWLGVFLVVALFCFWGVRSLHQKAWDLAQGKSSDVEMSVLGEVEPLADFMLKNMQGKNKAYLTGGDGYVRRFRSPLTYLLLSKGEVKLEQLYGPLERKEDGVIFYLNKKSSSRQKKTVLEGLKVKSFETSGKLDIFVLE